MADTDKRTNCVKVCFEDRLFIDLNREAIRDDRKLADYIYRVMQKHAYGNLSRIPAEPEGTERDRDAP